MDPISQASGRHHVDTGSTVSGTTGTAAGRRHSRTGAIALSAISGAPVPLDAPLPTTHKVFFPTGTGAADRYAHLRHHVGGGGK